MNSIVFVAKNNNNFYKLELAKTIISFVEYDFTYFWEQCMELGRDLRNTGRVIPSQFYVIRNLILKCHPYYEAGANTEFDEIVLDCIIEYICRSENMGLEELWARCISPKNGYEKAIFHRISEYKTNRAINEWANLMRVQEYARRKLAFIFDGEPVKEHVYHARKGYFDLAFSVAAKELGFPSSELPCAKRSSPSLLPDAPFMISRVSKGILKRISEAIDSADEPAYNRITDCMKDQIALNAFSYIKNLSRPEEPELAAAAEVFSSLSQEVYMPESFKAAIDLEIDKMLENGIFLQKCENCGKYFIVESGYKGRFCNRVNASGLTCREQADAQRAEEKKSPILEEMDERCKKIREKLEARVGDYFSEAEFGEWNQYLNNMIQNIQNGYSSAEDLEGFLDYSEKMYGELKQKAKQSLAAVESNPRPAEIPKTEPISPSPEPKKYRFPTLAELEERERNLKS
ncbi:MAG: hypothetical protein JG769_1614 [Oscillospiraceae bacterium]|jgi:hypothetical protein|nr:hypothetical protein [Oscillospiraceae bacterium]